MGTHVEKGGYGKMGKWQWHYVIYAATNGGWAGRPRRSSPSPLGMSAGDEYVSTYTRADVYV
eukprot:3645380-Prorocentrum_lima.AAC.1